MEIDGRENLPQNETVLSHQMIQLQFSRKYMPMNQPGRTKKSTINIDAEEDKKPSEYFDGEDANEHWTDDAHQLVPSANMYSYDPGNLLLTSANLMMNEDPMFEASVEPPISATNEAYMNLLPAARYPNQTDQNPWLPLGYVQLLDQYRNEQYVVSDKEKRWTSELVSDISKTPLLLNSDMQQWSVDKTDAASANKVLRPLNAYNYFFRDERDNLVYGQRGTDGNFPPPIRDFSDQRKKQLLSKHWFEDPVKGKRKHRKQKGIEAIPFTT
jgi:hypothetical protein